MDWLDIGKDDDLRTRIAHCDGRYITSKRAARLFFDRGNGQERGIAQTSGGETTKHALEIHPHYAAPYPGGRTVPRSISMMNTENASCCMRNKASLRSVPCNIPAFLCR